jgi:transcriptional regulator ATRX
LRSERKNSGFNEDKDSTVTLDDIELQSKWWSKLLSEDCEYDTSLSGKMVILAQLLKKCNECGDKILLFSTRLSTLDFIEGYLEHWSQNPVNSGMTAVNEPLVWSPLHDYCRIDGSTDAANRKKYINNFNDPQNTRMRLFLISTKAGGIGINLTGANRVIIFDASWNVSSATFIFPN